MDVAQLAFLVALAVDVFVLWHVRRHGYGVGIPHGELPVVVSATVLALVTFVVSGVADTVFIFQRAEQVPGSPSPLVRAIFGAI
jgi:hypothetical protein